MKKWSKATRMATVLALGVLGCGGSSPGGPDGAMSSFDAMTGGGADGGVMVADAALGSPDAAPGSPDAGPGTPDADPTTPDAGQSAPDAAVDAALAIGPMCPPEMA